MKSSIRVLFFLVVLAAVAVPLCGKLTKSYAQEEQRVKEAVREGKKEGKKEAERDREIRLPEKKEKGKPGVKEKIISDEAFRLFQKAKNLVLEGRQEEALELRKKAKEVEAIARRKKIERAEERPLKKRPPEEGIRLGEGPRLLEKAEKMEMEAERLRREAMELRQKARQMEAMARERGEVARFKELKEKVEVERAARERAPMPPEGGIREHLKLAERLRAEGKMDAAEEHMRAAEAIKRELKERLLGEKGVPEREPRFPREAPPRMREPLVREPMPGPPPMSPGIAELRRDVDQLREELAQIRRLLQELHQK